MNNPFSLGKPSLGTLKNNVYNKTMKQGLIVSVLVLGACIAFILGSLFGPRSILEDTVVSIPSGFSVAQSAELLEDQKVIRSAFAFKLLNRIIPKGVKSGSYEFQEGVYGLQEVRTRLASADYGDIYISVTIPEGSSINEIAAILERSDLEITKDEFIAESQGLEGYLFPDTYLFLPGTTATDVVSQLQETFATKTRDIQEAVTQRSFEDLVTMASLIEKEATGDYQEMRTVSGILWKRIDRGIALQVDAPFLYTDGKTSAQLSIADLRADGPYNTYTNRGLTPTPIGNPGLEALNAAVDPLDSPYLFYLHGNDGKIRYGVTHDDHVRNKNLYLR